MAKLLYFGRLADIIGTNAETRGIPDEIKTTADLRAWLDKQHTANGTLLERTVRIAINNEFVHEPATIQQTDEIAFMPPVGGG